MKKDIVGTIQYSFKKRQGPTGLTNVGIALSIAGVPLGMYFNHFFPFIEWSPVFMFVSVLLIASFRNLLSWRFPSFNKVFTTIILFQLLMIWYGGFSDRFTFQFLSFHLYIIVLIVALSSLDSYYPSTDVITCTFFVSAACSLFGAYFLSQGLVTGETAWQLRQEREDYSLEAFTVAGGALTNFTCALCLLEKKSWLKSTVILAIILDLYVILFAGKRTPIFVMLAITVIFFYKRGGLDLSMMTKYLKFAIITISGSLVLYFTEETFRETIDRFASNFYFGVLNMFGNTEVTDSGGSAINRFESRQWALDYINNEFGFFNSLFGAGYMTRWLDNPLLQSYLDMGILGLILYSYIVLVIPSKHLFFAKNRLVLLACLLCLYNIVSTISSGHPYAYLKYVPVVFLSYVSNLTKQNHYNIPRF